jgi:hypothetical protein
MNLEEKWKFLSLKMSMHNYRVMYIERNKHTDQTFFSIREMNVIYILFFSGAYPQKEFLALTEKRRHGTRMLKAGRFVGHFYVHLGLHSRSKHTNCKFINEISQEECAFFHASCF